MASLTALKNYLQLKLKGLLQYFNVANDLESQNDVDISIKSGISFKGSQLLVLIFAIFIASLGLNTNNVAVIIGAMLISPLMGPIIGMGYAIGIEDFDLLRRSLKNITMAILGSLAASALYFLISPQYEGSSQLLARTSPTIYDVFIALFGGAAGIVSIACKNKGQVMPGVAIATSLMPPLCTAGYGLATWQMTFFLGALYLFFTNMIFILFATWIGVKLMGFKKVVYQNEKRAKRVKMIAYAVVFATIGVSAYLTLLMVRKSVFVAEASRFVETQMVFPNTQVLSHQEYVKNGKRYIDVTLIGAALPRDSLKLAMMTKLDSIGLGGTILNIRQGFSMSQGGVKNVSDDKLYSLLQNQLATDNAAIDSLRGVIATDRRLTMQTKEVMPEIRVLFPSVRELALGRLTTASAGETVKMDTLSVAFVSVQGSLTAPDRAKLEKYLKVRLEEPDLSLSVNPSGFTWPKNTLK